MINYGVNKVQESFISQSLESIEHDLRYRLKKYSTRDQEAFEDLKTHFDPENPDVFLKKLNSATDVIGNDYLAGIPNAQKDIVAAFYHRQATTILSKGLEYIITGRAKSFTQVKALRQQVGQIANTFQVYMTENNTKMDEIIEIEKSVESHLGTLRDETQRNFSFVFDFMYSKMTVPERISAIKNGMYSLEDSEKEKELDKLNLLEKQQTLQNNIDIFLDSGPKILAVARRLGIDSDIIDKADTAFRVGGAVNGAIQAFTSIPPNYLAAIGAISSLFGLGGADPSAQRHQEVIRAFDKVFARFDEMDEKLLAILEGQQRIMEAQKQIFEQVIKAREDIARSHLEQMDLMRQIHGDVLVNRALILSRRTEEYTGCEYFSKVRIEELPAEPIVQTSLGIIPSATEFSIWFNKYSNREHCKECDRAVSSVYDSNDEDRIRTHFKAETYRTIQNLEITVVNDIVFKQSLQLLNHQKSTPFGYSLDKKHTSCYLPCSSFNDWNKKHIILDEPSFDITTRRIKDELLEPNIVALHAQYILNFHVYYLFIQSSDQALTYEQIKNRSIIDDSGKTKLIECLRLLNHTIAQQNLLQGDILVPLISQIFLKKQEGDPEYEALYTITISLLEHNSLLAFNFLNYQFYDELIQNGDLYLTSYAIASREAHQAGEISGLRALTSYPWEFKHHDQDQPIDNGRIKLKGMYVVFGTREYLIPQYQEMKSRIIRKSSDFDSLMILRDSVLKEISTYDIYEGLSLDDQRQLNLSILTTA